MLLDLAGSTRQGIDAVSHVVVDGPDFWSSEFGVRYLEIQRQLIAERAVRVRRLFVVDDWDQIADRAIAAHIAVHASLGIETRVMTPADAPPTLRGRLTDFTVFDGRVSYEMTTSTRFVGSAAPLPTQTTVIFGADVVAARQDDFHRLWAAASASSDGEPASAVEGTG
jgi:hypothetical protein